MGSRATESSTPHSTEAGSGDSKEEGGGGTKGARGNSSVKKIRHVRSGKIVDGFESMEEYFKMNSVLNGEPVEML